jgi:cation diffusion facilitator CzcD-associated flavoprotein CzcO
MATAFYRFSRRFPARTKQFLVGQVRQAIGGAVDVDTHFTPRYAPWDQRLCLVPDGDLFGAINAGNASVVTDAIDRLTEHGIRLASGAELPADLVVTATGLKLKLLGGIALEVDGAPVEASSRLLYKGIMLSDVPNLALALGYTNASWTLKSELTGVWVCRVLQHMDRHGYASCVPRTGGEAIETRPLLDLASGYVQRAAALFPRQGTAMPWRLYQNYVLDRVLLRHARVDDGTLAFAAAPRRAAPQVAPARADQPRVA